MEETYPDLLNPTDDPTDDPERSLPAPWVSVADGEPVTVWPPFVVPIRVPAPWSNQP